MRKKQSSLTAAGMYPEKRVDEKACENGVVRSLITAPVFASKKNNSNRDESFSW